MGLSTQGTTTLHPRGCQATEQPTINRVANRIATCHVVTSRYTRCDNNVAAFSMTGGRCLDAAITDGTPVKI
jgi:hypothetical protein